MQLVTEIFVEAFRDHKPPRGAKTMTKNGEIYSIQISVSRGAGYTWEFYAPCEAATDSAAKTYFAKWIKDITPSARFNFRLIKVFDNGQFN
jgi:hypothetical protein